MTCFSKMIPHFFLRPLRPLLFAFAWLLRLKEMPRRESDAGLIDFPSAYINLASRFRNPPRTIWRTNPNSFGRYINSPAMEKNTVSWWMSMHEYIMHGMKLYNNEKTKFAHDHENRFIVPESPSISPCMHAVAPRSFHYSTLVLSYFLLYTIVPQSILFYWN